MNANSSNQWSSIHSGEGTRAMTGRIKKLVGERGFGFIEAPDGKDVFFHESAVVANQFANLREGMKVEFVTEAGWNGKGPRRRAKSVKA